MIASLITRAAPSQSQTASNQTGSGSSNSAALGSVANEQTFLQLLVAQLENQDPTQPQDGTQFVAELAQFSSLEQEIGMRQDLDSINSILSSQSANTQNVTQQTSQSGSSQSNQPTQGTSQS